MSRSGNLKITNDHLIYEMLKDPDIDVREDGTVWTLTTRTGRRSASNQWRLAGTINSQGYVIIKYKRKNITSHRLTFAKYGNTPLAPDLVINHIDSNKSNNSISNLELVTQSHNNYHAFQTGKKPNYGAAKITKAIADQIRMLRLEGAKYEYLCKEFNVSKAQFRTSFITALGND